MSDKIQIEVVNRRTFILGASAVAALATLAPLGSTPASAKAWEDFMKEAIKGATPTEGKVKIDQIGRAHV